MAMAPDLLRAVIDRIIPEDDSPGALALGSDCFVFERLRTDVGDRELIESGLRDLPEDFTTKPTTAQDALLAALGNPPWFQRLVVLVSEGFYADPDNGGNDGARSWTLIGYRHGLPEGPSGPPARGARS
ncbi:MAG: gluconate 2-dehydrogenase subunit 3 family protein [Devosia sp.]